MKTSNIVILIVMVLMAGCEEKPTEPNVMWVGCPGVANPDKYYLNEGWVVGYEIGFRDDGVVVWRRKENDH